MSNPTAFDDIDLMQYADGELDEAMAAEIARSLESEAGDDARQKVRALEQMSDVLSSYLELEADDAEPRLDAMWEVIAARTQRIEPVKAQPVHQREKARATHGERTGLWATIVRFFEDYRGHILTGAVAAGAAAAIILALRPPKEVIIERPIVVRVPQERAHDAVTPGIGPDFKPEVKLVRDEPSAPEIEDLDISGGSGSVFLLPSQGEGDVSATVIFVDFNDVEGPL